VEGRDWAKACVRHEQHAGAGIARDVEHQVRLMAHGRQTRSGRASRGGRISLGIGGGRRMFSNRICIELDASFVIFCMISRCIFFINFFTILPEICISISCNR
jgi:hypothetical protein